MKIEFLMVFLLVCKAYSPSFSDFEIYSRKDSISSFLVAHNKTPANITLKISIKETDQIYQKYIISSLDSLMILKEVNANKEVYVNQINKNKDISIKL